MSLPYQSFPSIWPRWAASLACASACLLAAPSASAAPMFQGLWCGTGLLHEFSLKLAPGSLRGQFEGWLVRRGRVRELHGTVDGPLLRSEPTRHGSLVATTMGTELRIVDGQGKLALVKGASFRRAAESGCGAS